LPAALCYCRLQVCDWIDYRNNLRMFGYDTHDIIDIYIVCVDARVPASGLKLSRSETQAPTRINVYSGLGSESSQSLYTYDLAGKSIKWIKISA